MKQLSQYTNFAALQEEFRLGALRFADFTVERQVLKIMLEEADAFFSQIQYR